MMKMVYLESSLKPVQKMQVTQIGGRGSCTTYLCCSDNSPSAGTCGFMRSSNSQLGEEEKGGPALQKGLWTC